jgi:hypothetical protein
VARSRWRNRLYLAGVLAAGIGAGIVTGFFLVHIIIGGWGKI